MKKMVLTSLLAALIFSGMAFASDNQPAEETTPTVGTDQGKQASTADSTTEESGETEQDTDK